MSPTEKSGPDTVSAGAGGLPADLDVFWAMYPLTFQKMLTAACEYVKAGLVPLNVIAAPMSADQDGKKVRLAPTEGSVADAQEEGFRIRLVDSTAVIEVTGPIMKKASFWTLLFGGTSTQNLSRLMKLAVGDDDVKRIVLHIDSPGGSVSGLSELVDEMAVLREQKPMVSHIDSLGASAAYYIAANTNAIYAERTALVGSLGVIMVMYDWSGMFEKEGIKPVIIATGVYKSTGVMGSEITEEQQVELREIVDFHWKEFSATVMRGRNMSKDQLKELGTGRVWDAPAARKLGLLDGIKSLEGLLASYRSRSKRLRAEVGMAGIEA